MKPLRRTCQRSRKRLDFRRVQPRPQLVVQRQRPAVVCRPIRRKRVHPLHHKAGLLLRGVVLRGPLLVFQEAVLNRRNLGRGIDPKLFRIDLVERR